MSLDSQLFELYRLRSEELERNFYSLRSTEWQVYFQLYTGYAGIGAGYYALRTLSSGTSVSQAALGVAAISLLLVCLLVSLFLMARIQERVHFAREMQNQYLLALHAAHPGSNLQIPSDLPRPRYKRVWAAAPMQLLSVLLFIAVASGIGVATKWC